MVYPRVSRRVMIGGVAASGAVLLASCAALPPLSLDEAVRRLLRRATERALARLEQPGGNWDRFVAGIDLGAGLGAAALPLKLALMSPDFHRRLDAWLRPLALRAARAAAPRVAAAVRTMGIANARAVLAGGPQAATRLLRSEMGPAVIEALLPEFRGALQTIDDPVLRPVIVALATRWRANLRAAPTMPCGMPSPKKRPRSAPILQQVAIRNWRPLWRGPDGCGEALTGRRFS